MNKKIKHIIMILTVLIFISTFMAWVKLDVIYTRSFLELFSVSLDGFIENINILIGNINSKVNFYGIEKAMKSLNLILFYLNSNTKQNGLVESVLGLYFLIPISCVTLLYFGVQKKDKYFKKIATILPIIIFSYSIILVYNNNSLVDKFNKLAIEHIDNPLPYVDHYLISFGIGYYLALIISVIILILVYKGDMVLDMLSKYNISSDLIRKCSNKTKGFINKSNIYKNSAKFCKTCGKEMSIGQKICTGCGFEPLYGSKYCQECGKEIIFGQHLCLNCGINLTKKFTMKKPLINFCRSCGKAVKEDQSLCVACGYDPLYKENFCQQCGTETIVEQKLCVKCGFKLLKRK